MAEASIPIKRLIDNNPRALDVDGLEQILTAAWHGEPSRLAPVAA
jgi:alcohol dehydrogenase